MTNYAPLIIFAYRRLETLAQVFEHLINCVLALNTDVFVYSNAPIGSKEANDKEEVEAVREFIGREEWHKHFKSYSVILRSENNGPTENMRPAIDEVIRKYGRVIVLEDDIIPMPAFLQYMNCALDYYECDNTVFSICGYNPEKPDESLKSDSFLYPAFRTWGYALWLTRWDQCTLPFNRSVLCAVNFYDVHRYAVMYYAAVRHTFLTHSGDSLRYLDAQLAVNALAQQLSTVYPASSYCDCIGLEEGGETTPRSIMVTNNNLHKSPKASYVFGNKHIADISPKSYLYRFRKKEFVTDLYFPIHFDRNHSYHLMYLAMSKILAAGANVNGELFRLGIKKIALYGLGESAALFYEWFSRIGIRVLWGADKKVAEFFDLPITNSIEAITQMPHVDAIIVTAIHHYFEVEEVLSGVTNTQILAAEDIVHTVLQNLEANNA